MRRQHAPRGRRAFASSLTPMRRLLPLLLIVAAGCRDQSSVGPTDPRGGPADVSALVIQADPGPPQDISLSGTGDTYATAIVETEAHEVVYSPQPVINPTTLTVSNTFESRSPTAVYRYEVGYDPNGNQVAAQRFVPGDTVDGGGGFGCDQHRDERYDRDGAGCRRQRADPGILAGKAGDR
jgi:hypothetical protein